MPPVTYVKVEVMDPVLLLGVPELEPGATYWIREPEAELVVESGYGFYRDGTEQLSEDVLAVECESE